jgi:hypothetical protein
MVRNSWVKQLFTKNREQNDHNYPSHRGTRMKWGGCSLMGRDFQIR